MFGINTRLQEGLELGRPGSARHSMTRKIGEIKTSLQLEKDRLFRKGDTNGLLFSQGKCYPLGRRIR